MHATWGFSTDVWAFKKKEPYRFLQLLHSEKAAVNSLEYNDRYVNPKIGALPTTTRLGASHRHSSGGEFTWEFLNEAENLCHFGKLVFSNIRLFGIAKEINIGFARVFC